MNRIGRFLPRLVARTPIASSSPPGQPLRIYISASNRRYRYNSNQGLQTAFLDAMRGRDFLSGGRHIEGHFVDSKKNCYRPMARAVQVAGKEIQKEVKEPQLKPLSFAMSILQELIRSFGG